MPKKRISANARIVFNVFIDANVLVKWIALNVLASSKKTIREKREFIEEHKDHKDKRKSQMFICHRFVEDLMDNKSKKYKFMCSPLTLTEIFGVLFEQHVYGYMKRNYVSFSEFKFIRKEKFDEGTYDEIYSKHEKYFDKIKENIENAIEDRDNVFKISGNLISEYGLLSQDAHLVAQAIFNKCKYFVTTDGELLSKFTEDNQKRTADNKGVIYPIAVYPHTPLQKSK